MIIIDKGSGVKTRSVVNKSNKLIDGIDKLSRYERMIIFYVMAHINPYDDSELYEYEISVDRFIDFYKLDSSKLTSIYTTVKKNVNSLHSQKIKIEEEDGTIETYWAPSVKYFNREKKFRIRLSQDLKPYFLDLKGKFTALPTGIMKVLLRENGSHLYEGLYSRLLKKQNPIRLSLKETRDYCDVEDGKYGLYANFKQRILNPYIKKINYYSDMNIDNIFEVKEGRKIVFIEFQVSEKETNWMSENTELKKSLLDYGFKSDEIQSLIDEYDIQKISRNIEYVEKFYIDGDKKIKTTVKALIKSAISADYGYKSPFEEKQEKKKLENKQKKAEGVIFLSIIEKIKEEISLFKKKKFKSYLEKLSEIEIEAEKTELWNSDYFKLKNSLIYGMGRSTSGGKVFLDTRYREKIVSFSKDDLQKIINENCSDETTRKKVSEELSKEV